MFQRKNLLNKLTTRRQFYSSKMEELEHALVFLSRVRLLAAECDAMDGTIDDQDIAITVLCGLPKVYEHLIVAIDGATDDSSLSLNFVKSHLLQEEQRIFYLGDVKPSSDSALMLKKYTGQDWEKTHCDHCNKQGHDEQR